MSIGTLTEYGLLRRTPINEIITQKIIEIMTVMTALVLGINEIFYFIGNFKFIFIDSVVVTKLWKYHNE